MIINQEADELVYRAAFGCQKTGYIFRNDKTCVDYRDKFKKKDIIKACKEQGKELDKDYMLFPYVILSEENVAISIIDNIIKNLLALEHPTLGKTKTLNLWLTPSDRSNFRFDVVNTEGPNGMGYKAGRGTKPHYYSLIRQRVIDKWDAVEIQGYEADDALGLYQSTNTVASHIDKDINMISGWHYNYVTNDFYYIRDGLGELELVDGKIKKGGKAFFWLQMLTGDRIDNIPGIPKIGPKTAYNMLKDCKTELECYSVVEKAYYDCYTDSPDVYAIMAEIADLLYICTSPSETGRDYLRKVATSEL